MSTFPLHTVEGWNPGKRQSGVRFKSTTVKAVTAGVEVEYTVPVGQAPRRGESVVLTVSGPIEP